MNGRALSRRAVVHSVAAAAVGMATTACGLQFGGGESPKSAATLPPQTVEFWGPDPSTTPGMAAVANSFRAKYPNLNFNVTGGALNITNESRDKFIAATVAGNPPDSTYQDRWIPQSYVVWGAITYLDDRVKRSTIKPDEWWPYIRKDVT